MRAAHTASADLIAAPISPVEQAERLAERVHGEEGLVIRCVKKKSVGSISPPPSLSLKQQVSPTCLCSQRGAIVATVDIRKGDEIVVTTNLELV